MFSTTRSLTNSSLSRAARISKRLGNKNEPHPRYAAIERSLSKESNSERGYTKDEEDLILRTVNSCSADELKRYSMTDGGIKKLIAHRDETKRFETLDQVLLLRGVSISALDKFCRSILKKPNEVEQRDINARNSIASPPLDHASRIAIETSTGIWICGTTISWARLDTSCNLLEWNCQNIDETAMKNSLVGVVDSVARILSNVEPSDAYVLESDSIVPFSRMNSTAYYLCLQRQQITATIAAVLRTRPSRETEKNKTPDAPIKNVYTLRPRTSARLFDLLIGSENVSTRYVVESMMREGRDNRNENDLEAKIDPVVTKHWKSLDCYQREQMNWALLLALAFVHLSVRQTVILKSRPTRSQ